MLYYIILSSEELQYLDGTHLFRHFRSTPDIFDFFMNVPVKTKILTVCMEEDYPFLTFNIIEIYR